MKTAYCIYRNEKPKDTKEILHLIEHFCIERCLNYKIKKNAGGTTVNIEDENYCIELHEKMDGKKIYWVICCIHTSYLYISKKIA